jgi:hypothetical protein
MKARGTSKFKDHINRTRKLSEIRKLSPQQQPETVLQQSWNHKRYCGVTIHPGTTIKFAGSVKDLEYKWKIYHMQCCAPY